MELGLSLGKAAGPEAAGTTPELGLGLGVGAGSGRRVEGGGGSTMAVGGRWWATAPAVSPEPAVRLSLVSTLGLQWPPSESAQPRAFCSFLGDAAGRPEPLPARGFDVNRAPSVSAASATRLDEDEDNDERALSSSPNDGAEGGAAPAGGGERSSSFVLARERRGRGRLGAQEAASVQGAVRVPGGELQGEQHTEHQAEGGPGEAAQPPAAAGGSLVPEPASQDEAEADGGGLRVPEALLRDAHGGEPAAAQGARRAAGAQDRAALLHAPPGHHPLHVPVLRARRLQPGLHLGGARVVVRFAVASRTHQHQHQQPRRSGTTAGGPAVVVRRAVRGDPELPARLPAAAAGSGEQLLVDTCCVAWRGCAVPLVGSRESFWVSEAVRCRRVDGWDARSGRSGIVINLGFVLSSFLTCSSVECSC